MTNQNKTITLPITDGVEVDQEAEEIRFSKEEFISQVQEVTTATDIYSEDLAKGGVGSRRRENGLANLIEKFESKDRWDAFFDNPPLGYEYDEEWIQINPAEATKVRFLFQTFLEATLGNAYSHTTDKFIEKYGNPRIEIAHPSTLKRILKQPVYIGQPTVNTTPPNKTEQIEVSNRCPDLQIISTSAFENVQTKIERITDNFHADYDIRTIDYYTEKFSKEVVAKHCDAAAISNGEVILNCLDCGSQMTLSGGENREQLPENTRMGKYYCSDCRKAIVRPKQSELFNMHKSTQQTGKAVD